MERFENAKKGDEVFCEVYGDGKIVSCRDLVFCKILVEFMSSARESYTLGGRMHKKAIKPTLFYRKGTERNLTERPAEEINWGEYIGKSISVRDTEHEDWEKRKLYAYVPELDNPFICFKTHNGRVRNDICTWKYAKLIETVV